MVFQNWMSGCGFDYNATAAELYKNVTIKTAQQIKEIDACGFSTPFIMAWAGLAILIIILLVAKKWLSEEAVIGMPYNWVFSSIGILVYFLVVAIGIAPKISLVIGLASMFILGFLGSIWGGE